MATGVGAGLGGAALLLVLHVVQHGAYGYSSGDFGSGVARASGARRVLAMTVGGVTVGIGWWALRRWVRPVSSVRDALRRPEHHLPVGPVTAEACLQVGAVGFGAPLGREGAPRLIGAALGGWVAGRLRLGGGWQRRLVACGAGAGLAAVYNVPISGAVFTLEVLLASTAVADVAVAAATSVVATVVAWPVTGDRLAYQVPAPTVPSAGLVVWAVLAGPVAGLVGVGFARVMGWARARPTTGWRLPVAVTVTFTCLGVLAVVRPEVLGNGRVPAELAFTGAASVSVSAVLLVVRPVAAAACLRAGAAGGLLTPAVATGAVLGVLTGRLWGLLWPGVDVGACAVVLAAAVLATTERAPLLALVLLGEFVGAGPGLVAAIAVAVIGAHLTTGRSRPARPTTVTAGAQTDGARADGSSGHGG